MFFPCLKRTVRVVLGLGEARAAVPARFLCSSSRLASAGHLQKVQFPVNIYDYPVKFVGVRMCVYMCSLLAYSTVYCSCAACS